MVTTVIAAVRGTKVRMAILEGEGRVVLDPPGDSHLLQGTLGHRPHLQGAGDDVTRQRWRSESKRK